MIPFQNTWPYEIIMNDVYVQMCPFCDEPHVLLPIKKRELKTIQEGKKKLLVFPCCHNKVTVVDADNDYLLTAQVLRYRT